MLVADRYEKWEHLTELKYKPLIRKYQHICPYCKNEDTQKLIDKLDLQIYINYHNHTKFCAYYCFCCEAFWHYKNLNA